MSAGTMAGRDVTDPVIADGLIPPEIQGYLDHIGAPFESFGEQQIGPELLEPDEFDLEHARAFGAMLAIDSHKGRPCPLLVSCPGKAGLLERQLGFADRVGRR